MFHLHD